MSTPKATPDATHQYHRNHRAVSFLLALVMLAWLPACDSKPAPPLKIEVVEMRPMHGLSEKTKLLFKVTNVSGKFVGQAKTLITVFDADGNKLGEKSTYAVLGTKGGLAADASVERNAFVEVTDKSKADHATFVLQDVKIKE